MAGHAIALMQFIWLQNVKKMLSHLLNLLIYGYVLFLYTLYTIASNIFTIIYSLLFFTADTNNC